MAAAAGIARRWRAATIATSPAAVAATSTAIAVSIGRSAIHCSSPSTARVAHARSCAGLPNTTGLTAIHTPTSAASRQLRRHTGTSISGALAHLVHALHGLLCRANTARWTFRQSSIDGSLRPCLLVVTLGPAPKVPSGAWSSTAHDGVSTSRPT